MDSFHALLCIIGATRVCSDFVDEMSKLPVEVACMIFRKLDDASLNAAAEVVDAWKRAIEGDKVLRTRLRKYRRQQRQNDPLRRQRYDGMFNEKNTHRMFPPPDPRPLKRKRCEDLRDTNLAKRKPIRF